VKGEGCGWFGCRLSNTTFLITTMLNSDIVVFVGSRTRVLSMCGYVYSYGLSLAGHSLVTRILLLLYSIGTCLKKLEKNEIDLYNIYRAARSLYEKNLTTYLLIQRR
jgi:hypothetical protein